MRGLPHWTENRNGGESRGECALRGGKKEVRRRRRKRVWMETTNRLSITQQEQIRVEQKVFEIFNLLNNVPSHSRSSMMDLWRDKHVEFLFKGLGRLSPSYYVLDANRPWICYWILHSIALLGESIDFEAENNIADFLHRCQMPHLATTYAAVNSLITLGGQRALSSINRVTMHMFLLRMKDPSGAFRMHDAGEMDVRACYTAISVASVLNILDSELVQNVGSYILSCQTYEGGIAGEPGSEAHGGYTFCGLATMILINEADRLDLPGIINWVTFRQGVECGFQGRTNKLVDGCYSFWQGGALALIQRLSSIVDKQMKLSYVGEGHQNTGRTCNVATSNLSEAESILGAHEADKACYFKFKGELSDIGSSFLERQAEWGPLFHSIALQQYLLLCSQVLEGGFKDKPGKHRDFYHTCYCLSGLSVCHHSWSKEAGASPLPRAVLGSYSNLLEPIHPLYNVTLDRYYKARDFFSCS
ncbi:protein farnesyltransferase subunit beta isoform X2 [Magnolia sinica]|uniref:protein farnesyltransferase subunit beta isoform X2 n=1 Tax=Magnolia sinica TaxID=86752 RepID=UPI002658B952|nr:protein farnesyltransferase subunit beta isoform X2 [Magnolia sinica]